MIPGRIDGTIAFDDGSAYERFMGRWSRAAGRLFLDWVSPAKGARWLDVGCGTGAFTELIFESCTPAAVIAIDPAASQIAYARTRSTAQRAEFSIADAQALPFRDDSFDIVAAALVINFMTDRPRALGEMCRVARPGGVVTGYVWDFAAARAPNSCIALGLRRIGVDTPSVPGATAATLDALGAAFHATGFDEIATMSFDITVTFSDFEDFWHAQTPPFSPLTAVIAALAAPDRQRLIDVVRRNLAVGAGDAVACSVRANAIKARVPDKAGRMPP
jgi:SAM-dependent methyltransferase